MPEMQTAPYKRARIRGIAHCISKASESQEHNKAKIVNIVKLALIWVVKHKEMT